MRGERFDENGFRVLTFSERRGGFPAQGIFRKRAVMAQRCEYRTPGTMRLHPRRQNAHTGLKP